MNANDRKAYDAALEAHATAHPDHQTPVHCNAGAPGSGESLYCFDCSKNLWHNIRIQTIDEVR